MKLQKLPTELSIEELLKELERSSKEEDKVVINDTLPAVNGDTDKISDNYPILSFINAFNIKPGKNKVNKYILFTLYRLWNKQHKLRHNEFVQQMNFFLESTKRKNANKVYRYYYVNDSVIHLIKYIDHYKKFNKRKYSTNKNYKKYYEKFFKDIGITKGPLFIEADILYHVYDTYMYKRKRKSYSYHNFELVTTLLFETKYFTGFTSPWFGVSENIKQYISPEAVANWRKGRKLRGIKKKTVKEEDKQKIIYPEMLDQ